MSSHTLILLLRILVAASMIILEVIDYVEVIQTLSWFRLFGLVSFISQFIPKVLLIISAVIFIFSPELDLVILVVTAFHVST